MIDKELINNIKTLKKFISPGQLEVLGQCLRGEEKEHFFVVVARIAGLINNMPKTYEQDGKGSQAVAFLHYFKGGMDWYITEKDMEKEQQQAFGSANLGYGPELGYISIEELQENNIELDFYFKPQTLEELKAA